MKKKITRVCFYIVFFVGILLFGKTAVEAATEPDLVVWLNEKQDMFEAELTNDEAYELSQAEIGVWSEADGQDDLVWYPAEKTEEGKWHIAGSIDQHKKSTGVYFFHMYAQIDGERKFVASEKIQIEGISAEGPTSVEQNENEGTFRVKIGKVSSPAGIKLLNVAVWSDKGGQDDLKWYSGVQDEKGLWYADVDCKNHGYDSGTYIVHVYARDFRDVYTYLTGERVEVKYDFSEISVRTGITSDHSGAEVVLENISRIWGGTFEASVWSRANGQDDLRRYTMSREDHTGKISFAVKDHKYSTGQYDIHIYYKDAKSSRFVAGAAVYIEGISGEGLQVTACDSGKGMMKAEIAKIHTPAKVRNVRAAVWTERNGQDDLKWHAMSKKSDNTGWETTIRLSEHNNELGNYKIHVYASDERGVTQCVETLEQKVTMNAEVRAEVNEQQNQISLSVDPAKVPAGVQKLRFAVWSETGGQDDLKWYVFEEQNAGKIDIRNHKNSIGKYFVHAYAVLRAGGEIFAGGDTFHIEGVSSSAVKMTDRDEKKGTFRMTAEGVKGPAEVQRVRFAVWTKENGQDDLAYYSGRQQNGVWEADISTYAHNYESGVYYVHTYAKDARGVENYIGGIVFEFSQDLSEVALVINNDSANNSFQAVLKDNKVGKDITQIQFAVWSRVGGQDDLVWYPVRKVSENQWSKTVETKNHKKNSGIYYVHAYGITEKGERRCLKTTESMILNSWQPQVYTKEIRLENLSRDYKFLFIADTHVIVPDKNDDPQVQELADSRIPYFKNSAGMTSEEQFPYWIAYANSHQADGVLMGGDIVDYPSESNLKYLKENLSSLKSPYVYTFGNHDWTYPWEEENQEYRPMFDELMNGSGAAHVTEFDEFAILAVDNSTYQVAPEALEVADQAFSLGKPVILLMHIPLQTDTLLEKSVNGWGEALMIGPDGRKPNETTQKFIDKILAEDSPVTAILAGHVHVEDTSRLNDRITQYVVELSSKGKGILLKLSK